MMRSLASRLSPRDRRTLSVGAVFITAVLVFGRIVPAWRAWEREAAAYQKQSRQFWLYR